MSCSIPIGTSKYGTFHSTSENIDVTYASIIAIVTTAIDIMQHHGIISNNDIRAIDGTCLSITIGSMVIITSTCAKDVTSSNTTQLSSVFTNDSITTNIEISMADSSAAAIRCTITTTGNPTLNSTASDDNTTATKGWIPCGATYYTTSHSATFHTKIEHFISCFCLSRTIGSFTTCDA